VTTSEEPAATATAERIDALRDAGLVYADGMMAVPIWREDAAIVSRGAQPSDDITFAPAVQWSFESG